MFLPIGILFAQDYLAVLPLDARGLSEVEASILTDRLRSELFQTGKFEVVEREKMNQIFEEQNLQISGCISDACMVQIGQMMGVEQVVGGTVSKYGSLYSISIRLIDVATGRILQTAVYDHRGELEGLLDTGTRTVAGQLAFRDEDENIPIETAAGGSGIQQTSMQRNIPEKSVISSVRSNESWYTYWAVGAVSFNYPKELQTVLDNLESMQDVNRSKISLDMLGFYIPLYQSTLLGYFCLLWLISGLTMSGSIVLLNICSVSRCRMVAGIVSKFMVQLTVHFIPQSMS